MKQISTLAGNQVPSYFEWEVLFTMAIIGVGLLLFALLIGDAGCLIRQAGRFRTDKGTARGGWRWRGDIAPVHGVVI
ncbi:putative cyclic nucleotide-gated ion channel 20, chloroplastic [Castilleja foliolosa]|uniref:Cyclic nucleotide-gated ion channel 20, chloroplastic n=1 Tax=Castilleja foliolosa TaxID=1961234 RepID=A0ABD3E115_9LAMI